jgi:hypothetical protein
VTDDELERLAQRLGARAAEQLDVERVADAVVVRLRQRPASPLRRWVGQAPAWLRIAAGAVLILGVGIVARGGRRDRPPVAAVMVPLSEDLSGLSAAQLREAIAALDQPLSDDGGVPDTGLEGLTTDELRALLRSLEG